MARSNGSESDSGVRGEPTFGPVYVTNAVYAVCLIHLLLCILIMGYVVVGTPLDLEGVIVSPLLQWCYGTFTLMSIIALVCAGVGALYQMERHLCVYFYVLLISASLDIFLFVVFLLYGRSCERAHVASKYHVISTVYCGMRDGLVLLCLTFLVLFKLLSVWAVSKCRNYVRAAASQSLTPYLKKHLDNLALENKKAAEREMYEDGWAAETAPWEQLAPMPVPQYGATGNWPPRTMAPPAVVQTIPPTSPQAFVLPPSPVAAPAVTRNVSTTPQAQARLQESLQAHSTTSVVQTLPPTTAVAAPATVPVIAPTTLIAAPAVTTAAVL